MFRFMLALFLALIVLVPSPIASAAEPCGTASGGYSPGKTEEGFQARATDGCHTVDWTSSTTDTVGAGMLTFKTVGNINPWDAAYTLPKIEAGYCAYRAAHEANLWMTNRFNVPVGTEVTVSYRCW